MISLYRKTILAEARFIIILCNIPKFTRIKKLYVKAYNIFSDFKNKTAFIQNHSILLVFLKIFEKILETCPYKKTIEKIKYSVK